MFEKIFQICHAFIHSIYNSSLSASLAKPKKYNVGVAFHINGKMFVQTIK